MYIEEYQGSLKIKNIGFLPNLEWIPWMLTKISTSVYLNIVFGEKPHWKIQKRGFYQITLDFPKLQIKNNG